MDSVGADSSAVLVLGSGPAPAADWPAVLKAARQKIVALSRSDQRLTAAPGFTVATLERLPKEDEVRRQAEEQGRQRFRAAWVVALSLLVTMISIANAMLMSVTERFKEIGTMKCLGALSSFIRRIFLIESALVGLAGSVIGLLAGTLFTLAMYAVAYGVPLTWASMDLGWIALYAVLSLVAGLALSIVAAIYPASVASRMVPATALRSNI
jgi:cell division protein FtsX